MDQRACIIEKFIMAIRAERNNCIFEILNYVFICNGDNRILLQQFGFLCTASHLTTLAVCFLVFYHMDFSNTY